MPFGDMEYINVPLDLFLTKELSPAAKWIWLLLHFDRFEKVPRHLSYSPTKLACRAGVARSTVYEAFAQLKASSWGKMYRIRPSGKPRFRIDKPSTAREEVRLLKDLLRKPAVPVRARLFYGLLQATEAYHNWQGEFKWAELATRVHMNVKTVRRAVRELALAGWVVTRQDTRLVPIGFTLRNAENARKQREITQLQRKLDRGAYGGETLMRAYLSTIVDADHCEDDAAPEFLVNPGTGELMEFDRYYPQYEVAFEFNGPQHYRETERFTQAQVDAQRERDRIKRATCKSRGTTLIVVHQDDLSKEKMLEKVRGLLPLRGLEGREHLLRVLEARSKKLRKPARSRMTDCKVKQRNRSVRGEASVVHTRPGVHTSG